MLIGCDERDLPIYKDLCPDCTSQVTINGMVWPSDPYLAWYQYGVPADTFLHLEIMHTDFSHDNFSDNLFFSKIPLQEGLVKFNTKLSDSFHTKVQLIVYETGYDAPEQRYLPLYDKSSSIEILHLNKETGFFHLIFDLQLHPHGIPGGQTHNSSYPDFIHIEGQASGTITEEE